MQNDDVPKKRPQARFPPGPPQREAIQGASQGASKRRSKARLKARPRGCNSISARSRPPIEGTPGRTASILDTVRKEGGDNVRESSEPDNVRNLLSG